MELLIVEDDDAMASALAAAVVSAGHNPWTLHGWPAGPWLSENPVPGRP